MTTTHRSKIQHRDGCPAKRFEDIHHTEPRMTVSRCVDCGSQVPEGPAVSGALGGLTPPVDGGVTMRATGGKR